MGNTIRILGTMVVGGGLCAAVAAGSPARAGQVEFDGEPVDAPLAEALTAKGGGDLMGWDTCHDPRTGTPVDGCVVVSMAIDDGVAAYRLADHGDSGEHFAGYPVAIGVDARIDPRAEGELKLRVRVHGGIATSPLGISPDVIDPAAVAELPEVLEVLYALDLKHDVISPRDAVVSPRDAFDGKEDVCSPRDAVIEWVISPRDA